MGSFQWGRGGGPPKLNLPRASEMLRPGLKMTMPFCTYYKNLLNCYSNRLFKILIVFRMVMFIGSDDKEACLL